MMDKIRKGLRSEEGFTLVELMVVVLIIAILMAIAIPTFLGARQKAQDRAAQSDLRNGLTAAKVFYVDGETYMVGTGAGTADAYHALEPSIVFDDALANASTTVVSVTPTKDTVVLVKQSGSNTWFCLGDDVTGAGTTYGHGDATAKALWVTAAACSGGW